MSVLAGQTFYHAVTPPYNLRLLVARMDHIAVRSVSIVSVAGLFVRAWCWPCRRRTGCPGSAPRAPWASSSV
ncbi:MAG: hypothetical protein M0C28_11675 [Candidatus Moduliflexus flocculans]|nr:hypothetical protein [Candidatus Moduliflexus flocculans]